MLKQHGQSNTRWYWVAFDVSRDGGPGAQHLSLKLTSKEQAWSLKDALAFHVAKVLNNVIQSLRGLECLEASFDLEDNRRLQRDALRMRRTTLCTLATSTSYGSRML